MFQPVAAIASLGAVADAVWRYAVPVLRWLVPLVVVLWLGAAAVGRTVCCGDWMGHCRHGRVSMLVLGRFGAGCWRWCGGFGFGALGVAVRVSITGPASRQAEPSVVLFCAMLIVGSLGNLCFVGALLAGRFIWHRCWRCSLGWGRGVRCGRRFGVGWCGGS